MSRGEPNTDASRAGFINLLIWGGLVLLAGLSVFLINGAPLFYYDSPAYINQGSKILLKLGFASDAGLAAGTDQVGLAALNDDNTVNGSRSAVYSLIAAIFTKVAGVGLIPIANMMLVAISVWLPMRILVRVLAPKRSRVVLVALPLIAAMAGSLPFYIAFIMPDILTGILLLMIATLTVFMQKMSKWEILLAVSLGALAVVSHISHIAIAAAMVPVAALGALSVARKGWWIAPTLVLVMVLVGLGERAAFRVAARAVADSNVVYIPFLTARLIEDGPGLTYLEGNCPDPEIAACLLFDALSNSDDPMRFTASHIIFATKPHLGSFKFLSIDSQGRVAGQQYAFFFRVLKSDPIGTTAAIIRNTLIQAGLFSVEMTIPTDDILTNVQSDYAGAELDFTHGRLTVSRDWLALIEPAHTAVYLVSLAIILGGVLVPGKIPTSLKTFAILCVLGILANAFVCGAVSQPADRYGARVIWLLPFLAMVTALFAFGSYRKGAEHG